MRKQPRKNGSILALAIFVASCWLAPEKVALDDPRIQPMLDALKKVDRESLGFTAVPATADVRLELEGPGYDAMLHIYAETQRTIAFRKTTEGYRWIGEQETHEGPGTYQTIDGTFHEAITITYETEKVYGHPLNRINVRYRGDDPRLLLDPELTLDDVTPVLAEWHRIDNAAT